MAAARLPAAGGVEAQLWRQSGAPPVGRAGTRRPRRGTPGTCCGGGQRMGRGGGASIPDPRTKWGVLGTPAFLSPPSGPPHHDPLPAGGRARRPPCTHLPAPRCAPPPSPPRAPHRARGRPSEPPADGGCGGEEGGVRGRPLPSRPAPPSRGGEQRSGHRAPPPPPRGRCNAPGDPRRDAPETGRGWKGREKGKEEGQGRRPGKVERGAGRQGRTQHPQGWQRGGRHAIVLLLTSYLPTRCPLLAPRAGIFSGLGRVQSEPVKEAGEEAGEEGREEEEEAGGWVRSAGSGRGGRAGGADPAGSPRPRGGRGASGRASRSAASARARLRACPRLRTGTGGVRSSPGPFGGRPPPKTPRPCSHSPLRARLRAPRQAPTRGTEGDLAPWLPAPATWLPAPSPSRSPQPEGDARSAARSVAAAPQEPELVPVILASG